MVQNYDFSYANYMINNSISLNILCARVQGRMSDEIIRLLVSYGYDVTIVEPMYGLPGYTTLIKWHNGFQHSMMER